MNETMLFTTFPGSLPEMEVINEVNHPELIIPFFIVLMVFGIGLLVWAVILKVKRRAK